LEALSIIASIKPGSNTEGKFSPRGLIFLKISSLGHAKLSTVFYSGHSLIEAFDNCRASNGNIQRQTEKRIGPVFKSEKKKFKMLHKCFSFTISAVKKIKA
jgi:hypothetical protein